MNDRDFDRILEAWARHETQSAPEINPTPAMYKIVRARSEGERSSPFFRRWLAVSVAAAAGLVLAVIYPVVFSPSPRTPLWSARDLEIVGVRELPLSKKGLPRQKGVPQGRGAKGDVASEEDVTRGPKREGPLEKDVTPVEGPKIDRVLFRRLEFQFRMQDSEVISSTDIRGPIEESISLTSGDNYRLLIEPIAELHIYALQLSPSGALVVLFPNETYSPHRNPLGPGPAYRLPPEPDWFHPGAHRGKERLYLLASRTPLTELESLYTEYREETISPRRSAMLPDLLRRIEDIMAGGRHDASGWMFAFHHR